MRGVEERLSGESEQTEAREDVGGTGAGLVLGRRCGSENVLTNINGIIENVCIKGNVYIKGTR